MSKDVPSFPLQKKSGQATVTLASNCARKDVRQGTYGTKSNWNGDWSFYD